jgi:hypothetical protein
METRKFSSYLNRKHNASPLQRSIAWSDVMATRIFNSYLKENKMRHHYKDQLVDLTLSRQPEDSAPTSKKTKRVTIIQMNWFLHYIKKMPLCKSDRRNSPPLKWLDIFFA